MSSTAAMTRKKGEWRTAEGKAYFVKGPDTGYLKVSFFGPFYDSYVVFGLDEADYQYAYVTSSDRSSLWFLSRTPRVTDKAMERFIKKARELDFATDKLIHVEQKYAPGEKTFPMHPLKNFEPVRRSVFPHKNVHSETSTPKRPPRHLINSPAQLFCRSQR